MPVRRYFPDQVGKKLGHDPVREYIYRQGDDTRHVIPDGKANGQPEYNAPEKPGEGANLHLQ